LARKALLLWLFFFSLVALLLLFGSKNAGGLSPSPDYYFDGGGSSALVGHAFVPLLIKSINNWTWYTPLARTTWLSLCLPFDKNRCYRRLLLRWHGFLPLWYFYIGIFDDSTVFNFEGRNFCLR